MTKKTNENPDYQLTENGWFAYEYPRAAMTAYTVIFGFDGEALNVLLLKRGVAPFKGKWALPGGFLRMNETINQCAQRELSIDLKSLLLGALGTKVVDAASED